jgi:cytosine/adenosine deaminase-related metal-dependent hydrolase
MSKGAYDVSTLVMIFLSSDWQPKHVIIGLFEAIETTSQALTRSFIDLLDKYGLRKKIHCLCQS